MSFSRVINLYLNLDANAGNPLVSGLSNKEVRATPQFIQGDTALVRIWPRTETGSATSPLETARLATGTNPVLAGKSSAALSAATLLFSALTWTEYNTLAEDAGDWYYEAELNLNTTELDAAITALSGTATSLAVKCDIELQNADNTQRLTFQFDGSVLRQVYDGEADPTPGTPSYPLPATLLLTTNLATATVTSGEATVDFDITDAGLAASPDLCIPFGIQKPNHAADNIGILCAFPVNATTLRAYLTAAPTEAGYKATILFR